jgi:hypothetical protein
MVRKITLFEFHTEGSQFGPASIQTGTESEAVDTEADESRADSESKSALITFLQGVLGFFVLFFLLWVVFSRLTSDADE